MREGVTSIVLVDRPTLPSTVVKETVSRIDMGFRREIWLDFKLKFSKAVARS
jgi:hypothetical protein